MTITNKNSAYILLKKTSKVNSKITNNWRWNNNTDFASIFEDGNNYDSRRPKIEVLNTYFCFNLSLSQNRSNTMTELTCSHNIRSENYNLIEEKEVDFEKISNLMLSNVRILIFDKDNFPQLFERIKSGYYRGEDINENIQYIIAIKPENKAVTPLHTKISPKVWLHFENEYEGCIELPETNVSYLDYLDYNSPLTEGRSPIDSIYWFAEASNKAFGDLIFLESSSTEISQAISSNEKATVIKFKSILKGSKPSLPNFMVSNENHASGYSLIPYASTLKNKYWCRETKEIKQMKIKGFICTIDSATVKKYKKARQTIHSFITNLSLFDGEAILDPEKFEKLKKEMLKGHNTYSNHIVSIFENGNYSARVKYSEYSKQNLSSLNLSSLSSLNTSKKYRELKSITQTIEELKSKTDNLNSQINNHNHSVSRSKRLIEDHQDQIKRYQRYIENAKKEIEKGNLFLKTADENLQKNMKQLKENTSLIETLSPQREKIKSDYETSLNQITFSNNKNDKFLKSLNAQGIYIIDITYAKEGSVISVKDDPSIMFNVKKKSLIQQNEYCLNEIKFKVTKPIIVRVDPIEKGEDCPKIAIGPLFVTLNNNDIRLAPLTSNCILGMNSQKNTFWLHPHTNSFNLPTRSLQSFIDSLMSKTVRGCLGEASSAIYNAFKNQDPRQAIFAAMTWLTSANSSDAWGKYWKNFPKLKEINSMQAEISEKDYDKVLFESSISDSELILQNFFDNVVDETFEEQQVDWLSLEESNPPDLSPDEWEDLIEIEEYEQQQEQAQQLRTAGVQGYTPLYNTNNNN